MTEYPAAFALSDLDGRNGFSITGAPKYALSGYSVCSAGDVNGDGFADLIVGAPTADLYGDSAGAVYVVFGKASGFSSTVKVSSLDGVNGFTMSAAAALDRLGSSVAAAGDVNGDGLSDFVVGAPANNSQAGASYVVFGRTSGFPFMLSAGGLDGHDGFAIRGASAEACGNAVSAAGDVNGDGYADLLVGASHAAPNGNGSGAAYVVFGKASGFASSVAVATMTPETGFEIAGVHEGDAFGCAVSSAGDVNGDGFDDFMVGAQHVVQGGAESAGATYVVFGRSAGFGSQLDLALLDGHNGFRLDGEAAFDSCGQAAAGAGDLNADGFADVVVAAQTADPHGPSSGAAYVVFGAKNGFAPALALSGLDGANGFKVQGTANADHLGASVAPAGDFNGDGFDDLIVGAAGPPGQTYVGAWYVVFGKAAGFGVTLDVSALDGNNGFRIDGVAAYDWGGHVGAAGDVNGDGFDDLVMGAIQADTQALDSGATYVLFGTMPDAAVTRTGTALGNVIHGGDFNDTLDGASGNDTLIGHGGKDLLIGSKGADRLDGGAGADTLKGGGKADVFVYTQVSESTGEQRDVIGGLNPRQDKFELTFAIGGIDPAIASGQLSTNHFDQDLASAVGPGGLAASHAVLFTASSGRLSGHTFLVVDANGTAGYQGGADLVFELQSAKHLADLSIDNFV